MPKSSLDTNTPVTQPATTTFAPTASFVAAAGFIVEGVIALVHHTGDDHWDALSQVLGGAYALAALALIAALPAVSRWLWLGRVGRVAVVAAQVGFAAMVLESVVSGVHDGNILGGLFFSGLILALLGQLVMGITGVIGGPRRWTALLPFLALFVGILGGEHGGSIITGVVWAVIGIALQRQAA